MDLGIQGMGSSERLWCRGRKKKQRGQGNSWGYKASAADMVDGGGLRIEGGSLPAGSSHHRGEGEAMRGSCDRLEGFP